MRIRDWSSDVCSSDLEAKRSSVNKTFDLGDGSISSLFTTVINTYCQIFDFGGPIPLVPLGDSVSLNSQTGLPGTFRDKLNENSTSWMLGVNYKATPTLLLYARSEERRVGKKGV